MKSFSKIAGILLAVFSLLFSVAHGFEDDGTPYAEIARRVGPAPKGYVPLMANASDTWAIAKVEKYMKAVDRAASATGNRELSQSSCSDFHSRVTADRTIDIRYALGYFDDSVSASHVYAGLDWGKSFSTDEGVWIGLRKMLIGTCPNSQRRLCGFTELTSAEDRQRNGETLLSRNIEVQGRSVEVRLRLSYASASPFWQRNRTVLRAKQERLTRNSEENFFGGLRTADYVIYAGHSRKGGGPDFNPVRLNSAGKTDYYGFYRVGFPGRNRMIQELKNTSNRDVTVGIFSCDSNLHFRQPLLAVNPKQHMVLTLGGEGMLDYYDVVMASTAYLEGLLRGTCGSQLDDFARVTSREKAAYRGYNLN